MEIAGTPLVVSIRSSSREELDRAVSLLKDDLDVGQVVAERPSGRLSFDPALVDVGFKVLIAVAPAVLTKLVDWAIETARERAKRARKGGENPTLVIEVNGNAVSIKGTAKPAALRAALEAALQVRES